MNAPGFPPKNVGDRLLCSLQCRSDAEVVMARNVTSSRPPSSHLPVPQVVGRADASFTRKSLRADQ